MSGGEASRGAAAGGESGRISVPRAVLAGWGLLLLAGALGLAAACSDVQGPEPAERRGSLAILASYAPSPGQGGSLTLSAAYDSANMVAVRLVDLERDTTTVDRVSPFEPTSDTTEMRLETTLEGDSADFRLDLELLHDEDPLLEAERTVTLRAGSTVTAEVELALVEGGGPLEGRVVRAQEGTGIEGVSVSFVQASGSSVRAASTAPVVARVTTDSDGTWTSPDLVPDTYDILFEDPERENTTLFGVEVVEGQQQKSVGQVPLVPASDQLGSLSGQVSNASTGTGIDSATVELREGMSNTSGTALATTTSDSSGRYLFAEQPAGTYTVLATASNFADGSRTGFVVGGSSVTGKDLSLSPLGRGDIQIILTWGETPEDLDAHLTGPDSAGGRFHVYFGNMGSLDSNPYAALDVDDVTSFGPETISITRVRPGTYRYSVHDFTNRNATPDSPSHALAESGAEVEVFVQDTLAAEFFPPNEDGTLWTVFEIRDSSIARVDTMGYESSSSAIESVLPGAMPAGKTYSTDRSRQP